MICLKCKFHTGKKYCIRGRAKAITCKYFEEGVYKGKKFAAKYNDKSYEDNPIIKAMRAEQSKLKERFA